MQQTPTMTLTNRRVYDFYQAHPMMDFEQCNVLLVDLLERIMQDTTNSIGRNLGNQILAECMETKTKLAEISTTIPATLSASISAITNDIELRMLSIKKDYLEDLNNKLQMCTLQTVDKVRELVHTQTSSLANDISSRVANDTHAKIQLLLEQMNCDMVRQLNSTSDQIRTHMSDKLTTLLAHLPNNEQLHSTLRTEFNTFADTINKDNAAILQRCDMQFGQIQPLPDKIDTLVTKISSFVDNHTTNQLTTILNNFETRYTTLLQTIQGPILSHISSANESLNSTLIRQQETQTGVFTQLTNFLSQYKYSSSIKGRLSEQRLHKTLAKMFPSADIQDTSKTPHCGDLWLVRGEDKPKVLFENKNYGGEDERHVDSAEVDKFINDCTRQRTHGILLAQCSGIVGKKNYHVDIVHPNKILVYVHHTNYCEDKIQTALSIVDMLSVKLDECTAATQPIDKSMGHHIPDEVLLEINTEITKFVTHQTTLISSVREFSKQMIDQLNTLQFPTLTRFVCNKLGTTNDITFTCDICNSFVATTKKGLASHKKLHSNNAVTTTAAAPATDTPSPLSQDDSTVPAAPVVCVPTKKTKKAKALAQPVPAVK